MRSPAGQIARQPTNVMENQIRGTTHKWSVFIPQLLCDCLSVCLIQSEISELRPLQGKEKTQEFNFMCHLLPSQLPQCRWREELMSGLVMRGRCDTSKEKQNEFPLWESQGAFSSFPCLSASTPAFCMKTQVKKRELKTDFNLPANGGGRRRMTGGDGEEERGWRNKIRLRRFDHEQLLWQYCSSHQRAPISI